MNYYGTADNLRYLWEAAQMPYLLIPGVNYYSFCPDCQRLVYYDWDFCPGCGKKLKEVINVSVKNTA